MLQINFAVKRVRFHYLFTGFSALYPGSHRIGGWVVLRAGLETEAREKIFCLCRKSNPGR
jgi:hypothetical protein